MPEELELPIKGADACPHCGSKERVMEKLIAKLKKEGKLPEQSFPRGVLWQTVLFDPAKTTILATKFMAPVAIVFWDICGECKTIYCTGVELGEISLQAQMIQAPKPPPGSIQGGKFSVS